MLHSRTRIWSFIQRWFPPSPKHLHHLSRQDRPGLQVEIPQSTIELAKTALKEEKYDEALNLFDTATTENKENPWAWHGKGDAHQLKCDYKEALEAYRMASQLNPEEGLHWGGQANAFQGLGDIQQTSKLREVALGLDPSITWMFNDRLK